METEFEIKFLNVNIDEIRRRLQGAGAKLVEPMRLMRRMIIKNQEMADQRAFLRVRDEGDKTTLTYKKFNDNAIDGAKETEIIVSDFDKTAELLLTHIGIPLISYQESKRETWVLDNVEIVIDVWPWIKPYIEIEGKSEQEVQDVTTKLGFDWAQGAYGSVATAYIAEYPHLTEEIIFAISECKFENQPPEVFSA